MITPAQVLGLNMNPTSPDLMILQDNWSDLRRYREVPEIDFDRLRTYRMERIKSALREAEASMCVTNPSSWGCSGTPGNSPSANALGHTHGYKTVMPLPFSTALQDRSDSDTFPLFGFPVWCDICLCI